MATCPVCNDYEGEPQSVEAHISGSTDVDHLGEQGSNWRSRIEELDEGNLDVPADSDGTTGVSTSVDTEQAAPPINDGERATILETETSTEDVEVDDGEGSSVPVGLVLIVGTGLLILAVLIAESGDGTDSEEQQESSDDQQESSPLEGAGWS